jgi:xylulose-5-phosphate/fructose-6-phosphate phosphoketolase
VLRQEMEDRRTTHRAHVNEYGADMPEIVNWTWPYS